LSKWPSPPGWLTALGLKFISTLPSSCCSTLTSSSPTCVVHVANLGEVVKNTVDTKVSQQPFVSAFYQPQNSSVWQANVEKQMMFKVNRCNFDTGSHSVYLSSNAEPLSGNTAGINYDVYKLSTSELSFSNTSIAYSFKGIDQSKTVASAANRTAQIDSTFTSFSANRNITLTAQKKTAAALATTGPTTYSANNVYLRAIMKSNDSKVSPAIDVSRINFIAIENQVNRGSIANSDIVITNGGAAYPASGSTATISAPTSGTTATASVTVTANVVTAITVTAGGTGYYETPTITLSNAASGTDHATATVQSELGSNGGNAKTRYITRRVTLEDGFDAQDLKVMLNAYKPKDTDIKVYYRVHNADDSDDFETKPYVLMTQQTDSNRISANESDIHEYAFKSPNDVITYTSSGVTYDKFKTFAIKIVLGSASSAIIPKVKDLKAIALDF